MQANKGAEEEEDSEDLNTESVYVTAENQLSPDSLEEHKDRVKEQRRVVARKRTDSENE